MFKRIIFIIILTVTSINASARNVCGMATIGLEIAYTTCTEIDGEVRGTWVAGHDCADGVCATPIVTGDARCANSYNAPSGNGTYCWCRRTAVASNSVLTESIGKWIHIGTPKNCANDCARHCAENVSSNANGMRNAIMLLPA